jgi:hypothetical protein
VQHKPLEPARIFPAVQPPRGSQDKWRLFLAEVISALNKTINGVHGVLGILCRYVDSKRGSDILTIGPCPFRDCRTVVSNESFTEERERKLERDQLDQFGSGRWILITHGWFNVLCIPNTHLQCLTSEKGMVRLFEGQLSRHFLRQLIELILRKFDKVFRHCAAECHTDHALWYSHPQSRSVASNGGRILDESNGEFCREREACLEQVEVRAGPNKHASP